MNPGQDPTLAEGFIDQGTYAPDHLIAGEFPRIRRVVPLLPGPALAAGSVLGKVAVSGAHTLSAATAGDGSETPVAVLVANTKENDEFAHVFLTGEFDAAALQLGDGHTIESITEGLRQLSIFIR